MLLAEKYFMSFCNGVRGTTSAKTFSELRMEMHIKSAVAPTSGIIKEYLIRGLEAVQWLLTGS